MRAISPFKREYRKDIIRLLDLFPTIESLVGTDSYHIQGDVEIINKFEKLRYQFENYQTRLNEFLNKIHGHDPSKYHKFCQRSRIISHKNKL